MAWIKDNRGSRGAGSSQWKQKGENSGVGRYVKVSKSGLEGWHMRAWAGNSIGFAHGGGNLEGRTFQKRQEAFSFAKKWMRDNPEG